MKCARCNSEHHTKNGVLNGVQRYKCKSCGFNFTVEIKSTAKSEDVKRQALLMYLEGLGFHSIGRILKVSHVSIINWIKKFGGQVDTIRNDKPVKIMELDELHTYIGHKKTTNGFGLVLVETKENTLILSLETGVQKQG